MKIEAREGTFFEEVLVEFFEGGRPYRRQGVAACFGHIYEVPISTNPYNCMDYGTDFKVVLWWDTFVL